MNDSEIVDRCSTDQNERSPPCFVSSVSVDEDSSADDDNCLEEKTYKCKQLKCQNLVFTSESEWHKHIVEHIALPTVKVRRLTENEQKKLLAKKKRRSNTKAGPRSKTDKSSRKSKEGQHESLKFRVKVKPGAGSDQRTFEGRFNLSQVVRSPKILFGPGGIYCANGELDEVKKEIIYSELEVSSRTPPISARPSNRGVALDSQEKEEACPEVAGEEASRSGTDEHDEEQEDPEAEGARSDGDANQEEESGQGECAEKDGSESPGSAGDDGTDTAGGWEGDEEGDPFLEEAKHVDSPTPSEILRPTGLLAPEQAGDDDSCYPHSPSESDSSRMVELNGSGAGVSGSDNDSGHSRSPATFPGSSAGGEDDIQDSSQPNFNWDDIVNDTSESAAVNAENDSPENRDSENTSVPNDGDGNDGAEESQSLLLGEANDAPSTNPTIGTLSVRDNLLQEFPAESFSGSGSDADRPGETEYMSLDRLGDSSVCCEVCGERAPSRQSLEEHRAAAGHYKCSLSECGTVLSSSSELAAHNATAHPTSQRSPVPRGTGTPPVQQLAQQVQRIPIPQQQQQQPGLNHQPYPPMTAPALAPLSPFGMVPQSISPHGMVPQSLSPHGMVPQSMSPQQQQQQLGGPPNAQQYRRPPGYPVGQPGHPYGPGSPNQTQQGQGAPNQGMPFPSSGGAPYPGSIQPRPLNTLVAPQQPVQRAPMQVRMAGQPGMMMPQQGVPRGMAPAVRAQKRVAAPILPQPAGRGVPVPPLTKQRRVDIMPAPEGAAPGKKSDAKAVANILATRGITVTPAGVTRPGLTVQQMPGGPGRPRQNAPQGAQPQPQPQPVTTLNLNSAISIIPTANNNGRQQSNAGFVVPHGRSARSQPLTTNVERPPRPPTVDLTGDGPPAPPGSTRLQMGPLIHRGRGRPSSLQRTTCQICDKVFTSPEQLAQHMMVHRNPGKLPYRCNLCNAQYPTQQGLTQHRQTYHKESAGVAMGPAMVPGEEMVIPLVDLKQPGVAARLGALGIHHCIPLSGLGNQSNGFFHLPVVSIDGSRTSAASNLRSLGASGVLSIGPIKLVPRVPQ